MNNTLESTLKVENIRLKAFHGWYPEERVIGGMYRINVVFYDNVSKDENFSDLDESVNYERIYNTVLTIMKQEFHLIEQSCKALFEALHLLKSGGTWEVEVVKENPPMKHVGATRFKLKG